MQAFGTLALQIILLSVMLTGLVSLIIPVLPGLLLIWLSALIYLIIDGLTWGSGIFFFLISALTVFGSFTDEIFMSAGAKKTGAPWFSVLAALIAMIIGTLVLPPIGGLLFALISIFVVEWIRLKEWREALESTRSMAVGFGWGVLAKIGVGMVMIILWLIWVFLVP
ncbi:MAG: DUF456 domain-containing protein [Anaerolineaceae bacterium]|nr:DUF456 domain-containing protein [Anaerolineaceae bacterium]